MASRQCIAASLGGCSPGLSREHYISRNLFSSETIYVEGFPWSGEEPKEIGVDALTARILCSNHNSVLSELDDAAKNIKNILFGRFAVAPSTPRKSLRVESLEIDGTRLERWCIKFAMGAQVAYGLDDLPSRQLLEACFGRRSMREPAGLYLHAEIGQEVAIQNSYGITALLDRDGCTKGWQFRLWGWMFVLWSEESLAPSDYVNLKISSMLHRPRQLKYKEHGRLRQRLHLTWQPAAAS